MEVPNISTPFPSGKNKLCIEIGNCRSLSHDRSVAKCTQVLLSPKKVSSTRPTRQKAWLGAVKNVCLWLTLIWLRLTPLSLPLSICLFRDWLTKNKKKQTAAMGLRPLFRYVINGWKPLKSIFESRSVNLLRISIGYWGQGDGTAQKCLNIITFIRND